jgi:TolB-like protein/Tfp pilus assembly protein PilF
MTGRTTFGPFQIDPARGVLLRDGQAVAVGQRGIALLCALQAARGQTVAKADLMEAGWPGLAVEEGNLTVQIAGLRKLLGPGPQGQDWIVTVPRVGYRLVATAATDAAAKPQLDTPMLAVLPFANLSGDPAQEYFADGIVEDIITALSRFRSLTVTTRHASFAYRGKATDLAQTALELGVRYLLQGSVRHMAGRFRITAQLVDAETSAYLWSQNFDGAAEEIFEVQDRITASVAAIVAPRIELAEITRSRLKPPGSLVAYDYYLRALQKHNTFLDADNLEAIALLHKAIDLAPDFAPALVAAAYGYEHRVTMGWPPASPDDSGRALMLANAAVATAPDDPLVLARSGFFMMSLGRDYDRGLKTILRAVEINPNNITVLIIAGAGHIWSGDLDLAMGLFRRVLALSPGNTSYAMTGVAHVLICQGKYEDALDWARRSLAEEPNFDVTHWIMTAALAKLGQKVAAKRALSALLALSPGLSISRLTQANHSKYPERWGTIFDGLRLAGMAET